MGVIMTEQEAAKRISEAIRRRNDAGETLVDIGRDLNVHWTTVHHWMHGRRLGNTPKLMALATQNDCERPAA